MSDIGIGIIDINRQKDLNQTFDSISNDLNVFIASNTDNTLPECHYRKYNKDIQPATLRNWLLSQFRLKNLKHFFLIESGFVLKDNDVFQKTIKNAETFGTWAMTGPAPETYSIEDDELNLSLKISEKLNHKFIYLFNGIISNVGYFDERFYSGKNLDVLDYIIRLRDKKIYPPVNYNPIIDCKYEDLVPMDNNVVDNDNKTNIAYGYFLYKNKFIPNQNDPKTVSKDELLKELENLQNKYAKR